MDRNHLKTGRKGKFAKRARPTPTGGRLRLWRDIMAVGGSPWEEWSPHQRLGSPAWNARARISRPRSIQRWKAKSFLFTRETWSLTETKSHFLKGPKYKISYLSHSPWALTKGGQVRLEWESLEWETLGRDVEKQLLGSLCWVISPISQQPFSLRGACPS